MNRDNVHANCGQLLWYTFGSLVLLTGVCLRGGGVGWGKRGKKPMPSSSHEKRKETIYFIGRGHDFTVERYL